MLKQKNLFGDGQEMYTLPTVIREVYVETAAKVEVVGLVNVYEHNSQSVK